MGGTGKGVNRRSKAPKAGEKKKWTVEDRREHMRKIGLANRESFIPNHLRTDDDKIEVANRRLNAKARYADLMERAKKCLAKVKSVEKAIDQVETAATSTNKQAKVGDKLNLSKLVTLYRHYKERWKELRAEISEIEVAQREQNKALPSPTEASEESEDEEIFRAFQVGDEPS